METINLLSSMIGSIGFPCVMSILLLNRMNRQDELHKKEIDNLNSALNNNTEAVNKLVLKLEVNNGDN